MAAQNAQVDTTNLNDEKNVPADANVTFLTDNLKKMSINTRITNAVMSIATTEID